MPMSGREQVAAYATLYQPKELAGLQVADLVDVPTSGRCEVIGLIQPSLLNLRTSTGAEGKCGWKTAEGHMLLESWTVWTVVLIPFIRAGASGLIRESVQTLQTLQTLQPSPERTRVNLHPCPCRVSPKISVTGVEPMSTPAEQLKPGPTILQAMADR